MPTIAEYLKYANLQMAAEALFQFDATKPVSLTPGQTASYSTASVIQDYLKTGNLHIK